MLVLALGDHMIAQVNLRESVAQQDWVFEQTIYELLDSTSWISRIPEQDHLVLVSAEGTLAVIDLDQNKIVDAVAR